MTSVCVILFIVVTDFQLTLLPMRLYFRFPLNLHTAEEPLGGETLVSHLTRADSGSREQPESPWKKADGRTNQSRHPINFRACLIRTP